MKENKKILLLATTSYAGMGPYVASIVNSFEPEDNVRFFLVENEDKYYTRNIRENLQPYCYIYMKKTYGKLKTLHSIIFNTGYEYANYIKQLCIQYNIDVIHSLTSLTDVKLTKFLSKNFKLLYTIHDLHPHEARKVFYKSWKQAIEYKRIFKAISNVENLYTNSTVQLNEQLEIYPTKKNFYSPFPTLITPEISNGEIVPKEVVNIGKYILFFGRIEAYKGVENLILAFQNLQAIEGMKDYKLVIAGKGNISINIETSQIIRINRYIDDREMKALYSNAEIVVYPYLSATQSGVLSVASYFGKPMLLSDVDFFKEVIGNNKGAILFKKGSVEDLMDKLKVVMDHPILMKMGSYSRSLYDEIYSKSLMRRELMCIYNTL